MGTKTNKVIVFEDKSYEKRIADVQVPEFLILSDSWVCDSHQMVFCVQTNTFHAITDYARLSLDVLKPKERRVSGMALMSGRSNWERKEFSCIKVADQATIKEGYTLIAKYSKDTSTLS